MGRVWEAMKGDGAQMSAGGRGDLTSSKSALLCPSRVEDTFFSLGVTQWAGWFLSGGGCRDQMRLPPVPGTVAQMLQGWELHPQPLLGAMTGTRGIRDAEHWTEHWKTIPEAPLRGELVWQAMGSSCRQLPSPCVAPCYLLGMSASSCPKLLLLLLLL